MDIASNVWGDDKTEEKDAPIVRASFNSLPTANDAWAVEQKVEEEATAPSTLPKPASPPTTAWTSTGWNDDAGGWGSTGGQWTEDEEIPSWKEPKESIAIKNWDPSTEVPAALNVAVAQPPSSPGWNPQDEEVPLPSFSKPLEPLEPPSPIEWQPNDTTDFPPITSNISVQQPSPKGWEPEELSLSLPPIESISITTPTEPLDDEWTSMKNPYEAPGPSVPADPTAAADEFDEFDDFEDSTSPPPMSSIQDPSDVWGSQVRKLAVQAAPDVKMDKDVMNALAAEEAFKLRQVLDELLQTEAPPSVANLESINHLALNTEGHFDRLFRELQYTDRLISSSWWKDSATKKAFERALGLTAHKSLHRMSGSFASPINSPMLQTKRMSFGYGSTPSPPIRDSFDSGQSRPVRDSFDSIKAAPALTFGATNVKPQGVPMVTTAASMPSRSVSQTDQSFFDSFGVSDTPAPPSSMSKPQSGSADISFFDSFGVDSKPAATTASFAKQQASTTSSDPFGDLSMFDSQPVMSIKQNQAAPRPQATMPSFATLPPQKGSSAYSASIDSQHGATATATTTDDDFFDSFWSAPALSPQSQPNFAAPRSNTTQSRARPTSMYSTKPTQSLPPVSLTTQPITTNFKIAPALPPPPPGRSGSIRSSIDSKRRSTSTMSNNLDLFANDEFGGFETPPNSGQKSAKDDLSFLDGLM